MVKKRRRPSLHLRSMESPTSPAPPSIPPRRSVTPGTVGTIFEFFPNEGAEGAADISLEEMSNPDVGGGPRSSFSMELDGNAAAAESAYKNRTAAGIRDPNIRRAYLVIEDPSSSSEAFFLNVFITCSIIFGAFITIIETIPELRSGESDIWWIAIETCLILIYSLELLVRFYAHADKFSHFRKFILSPLTILDIVVVASYYIEWAIKGSTTYIFRLSILRLFRLFRVFRVYKYSSLIQLSIEVMIIAIKKSADALSALFFFMFLTIILFSALLYFAERGIWDEAKKIFVDPNGHKSTFDSIPASFWFVMVTLTTTGYGDMVPTTFVGKLISFPVMMIGIVLIALPSIIVGRNFTIVWEIMRERGKIHPSVNNNGDDDEYIRGRRRHAQRSRHRTPHPIEASLAGIREYSPDPLYTPPHFLERSPWPPAIAAAAVAAERMDEQTVAFRKNVQERLETLETLLKNNEVLLKSAISLLHKALEKPLPLPPPPPPPPSSSTISTLEVPGKESPVLRPISLNTLVPPPPPTDSTATSIVVEPEQEDLEIVKESTVI